jgi:nucleotide-binding universal stress UspA family protein
MGVSDIDLERKSGRERILLAVEAGPTSEVVINAAARLAPRLQAEVLVLSVRERDFTRGFAWDIRPAAEVAEVVSQAICELQQRGITSRGLVGKARVGRVAEEIVYAALKYHVDEIMIGCSGRSVLGRIFSSNVSPRVLRLSPLPVVSVPTGRARLAFPVWKQLPRRQETGSQPAA